MRILKLLVGLFFCAVGIVLTINAKIGLSPWDVFHHGITKITGISMGKASISTGIVIVIINSVFKEKVGWGTLINMVLIGIFMDILMLNELIPVASSTIIGTIMMILGMMIMAFGTYLYISCGLGSGPRDGLMRLLTKKSGKSVRFVRNSIEISASIVGYILGGSVGVGTVIIACTLGYFIQFVFKLMKFELSTLEHRFIDDDIKFIKNFMKEKAKDKVVCDEEVSL